MAWQRRSRTVMVPIGPDAEIRRPLSTPKYSSASVGDFKPVLRPIVVREKSSQQQNHVRFSQHDMKHDSYGMRLENVPSGEEQHFAVKQVPKLMPRLHTAERNAGDNRNNSDDDSTVVKRKRFLQSYQESVMLVRKELSLLHKKVDRKLQTLALGKIPKEPRKTPVTAVTKNASQKVLRKRKFHRTQSSLSTKISA